MTPIGTASQNQPAITDGTRALRVACYNIAHGRGVADSNWEGGEWEERKLRLDEIAQQLVGIDADVVVLNEVDFDCSWSYHLNQAEYLADAAGYPFRVEQRNLDFRVLFWTWRFGNAILSKHPIDHAAAVEFPNYATWEQVLAGKKRGVQCSVSPPSGKQYRIVGTHLSHRSEDLRVRSAAMINRLVADSKLPTIVAGGMNSTPAGFPWHRSAADGRNAIATFDHSGLFNRTLEAMLPQPEDLTFPSTNPVSVIDWILLPNDYTFRSHRVVPSTLSDHHAVVAEILY